jgi:hypothetical protein
MALRQLAALAIIVATVTLPSIARAQGNRLYDSIDCSQWKQNPDRTWNTGPNARLDGMVFPNSVHLSITHETINGVDLAQMLLQKCGAH